MLFFFLRTSTRLSTSSRKALINISTAAIVSARSGDRSGIENENRNSNREIKAATNEDKATAVGLMPISERTNPTAFARGLNAVVILSSIYYALIILSTT